MSALGLMGLMTHADTPIRPYAHTPFRRFAVSPIRHYTCPSKAGLCSVCALGMTMPIRFRGPFLL
jgi:hypothetical protein